MHSSGSGARSPSIENTPSVMINFFPERLVFSCKIRWQSFTSLCLNTLIVALESRAPSIIDAWFNSSEIIKSSLPSTAETVPAFAVKPDWKTTQASTFLNFAICSSNCMCSCMVPAMVRTAPAPAPYVLAASTAAFPSNVQTGFCSPCSTRRLGATPLSRSSCNCSLTYCNGFCVMVCVSCSGIRFSLFRV